MGNPKFRGYYFCDFRLFANFAKIRCARIISVLQYVEACHVSVFLQCFS